MSEQPANIFIDRFTNHALHGSIQSLDGALDRAAPATEDGSTLIAIARTRDALAYVKAQLAACDPALVPEGILNNLNSTVLTAANEMSAFANNQNVQHITNANAQADGFLIQVMNLPVMRADRDAPSAVEAMKAFRRAIDAHLASVRTNATGTTSALEELRTKITASEAEIAAQKTRLDTALSQFQTSSSTTEGERSKTFNEGELKRIEAASAAEEQRRVQHATAAEERKAAFDALLADAKNQFDTLLTETEKRFDELSTMLHAEEDGRTATFTTTIGDATKGFQVLSADLQKRADVLIAAIDEQKAKAETLVHVIGNTGMVGGYQSTADEERTSMWIWQGFAILGMIGLVTAAILVALAFKDISWPGLVGRVFVASAFAAMAAYAGRQAAVHRDAMRRNRRMQLELSSIDPYLAPLPDAERIEVKRTLAGKWFGQPDAPALKDERSFVSDFADMAKNASESAKTLSEAVAKKP